MTVCSLMITCILTAPETSVACTIHAWLAFYSYGVSKYKLSLL